MNGQLKRVTDAELARLRAHPEAVPAFLFGAPDASEDRSDLDLEKAWHGLHVVLTGTAAAGRAGPRPDPTVRPDDRAYRDRRSRVLREPPGMR